MSYDRDGLDRALFALPLETPPEDLRASILAGTVYRPAFPFKEWEFWIVGLAWGVAGPLSVFTLHGGVARRLSAGLATGLQYVAKWDLAVLAWFGFGVTLALWLSHLGARPRPSRTPARR